MSRVDFGAVLLTAMMALTVIAALAGQPGLMHVSGLCLGIFIFGGLRGLGRLQHALVALAVLGALSVLLQAGGEVSVLMPALRSACMFAATIAAVTLFRGVTRGSAALASAGRVLMAQNPAWRSGGMVLGGHFLGIVFSVGIIGILVDVARAATGRSEPSSDDLANAMIGVRATALLAAWSPLALTLPVISQAFPGIDALAMTGMLAVFAVLFLLATAVYQWLTQPMPIAAEPLREGDKAAIVPLVLQVLGLLAAVVGLVATGLPPAIAICIAVPAGALFWLVRAERPLKSGWLGRSLTQFWQKGARFMPEARPEITVFAAAGFFGASLLPLLESNAAAIVAVLGDVPNALILILTYLLIVLAGQLALAPSVSVVIAAQILAVLPGGASQPYLCGLALALGWAGTINTSPVSAALQTAARITGMSAQRLGLRVNLPYALGFALASAMVLATLSGLGTR